MYTCHFAPGEYDDYKASYFGGLLSKIDWLQILTYKGNFVKIVKEDDGLQNKSNQEFNGGNDEKMTSPKTRTIKKGKMLAL